MTGTADPWFPEKALGAGCGTWAVRAVRAFVDEFVAVIGCAANYRDFNMDGEQP